MPDETYGDEGEPRGVNWGWFVATVVGSGLVAVLLWSLTPHAIYTEAATQFYVVATAINSAFLIATAAAFSSL